MIISTLNTIVLAADKEINVDSGLNLLDQIRIPLFLDLSGFDPGSATILSVLTSIGILATIAIAIFWIYRILVIGIETFKSEGKPEALQGIFKKLQNILAGVFLSLLFPVILSIIGIFAGIGTVFDWPRMFRSCNDEPDNFEYYYQAVLGFPSELNVEGGNSAVTWADDQCGY